MRNITIVYKDVTANKITVAQDEIRIKVRPCDEYNVNLAKFINYCMSYFENKVYPVTTRFRIEQTVNTCSLQIPRFTERTSRLFNLSNTAHQI